MNGRDTQRFIVTCMIFVLFAFVLWYNVDDEMLIGAMIGSLTTAVAFWLGSSKGSADKTDMLEVGPRRVQIDQPPDEPVPVEEK